MNEKEIVKVIITLAELTSSNTVKWDIITGINTPGLIGYENLEGNMFRTKYKNKILCFYEYGTRQYYDEDQWHPVSGYRLLFIDENNNKLYQFPESRALGDLYQSVSYQIADVDDFLTDLLSE